MERFARQLGKAICECKERKQYWTGRQQKFVEHDESHPSRIRRGWRGIRLPCKFSMEVKKDHQNNLYVNIKQMGLRLKIVFNTSVNGCRRSIAGSKRGRPLKVWRGAGKDNRNVADNTVRIAFDGTRVEPSGRLPSYHNRLSRCSRFLHRWTAGSG